MTVPKERRTRPKTSRKIRLKDLTRRSLFHEVDHRLLEGMLHKSYSRVCKLEAGERLESAQLDDHVYVIISGYLSITAVSRFNPEKTFFMAWRGPEQIIGEMRPEEAVPSSAIIRASNRCELLEITRASFDGHLVENSPVIYRNMVKLLLEKLASERHRSDVIQTTMIEMKVAQTLVCLAEERAQDELRAAQCPLVIPGPINQIELGKYVGGKQRETVNHPLSAFKKGRIINYRRSGPISILDWVQLNQIAEDPVKAREYRPKKRSKESRKK